MNKDTRGKLPLHLVPPRAIESIARVREFGVNKYHEAWDWVEDVDPDKFLEAAARHLLTIRKESDLTSIDPESGLLHLEHALCSLSMAIEIIKRKEEEND